MKPGKRSTSTRQKFSVADARNLYFGVCPMCRSVLFDHHNFIQLYDNEGNAYDFEEVDLLRCNSCHNFFMDDTEFGKLVKQARTIYQDSVFFEPENMDRRYDPDYGGYVYSPKPGNDNGDLFIYIFYICCWLLVRINLSGDAFCLMVRLRKSLQAWSD